MSEVSLANRLRYGNVHEVDGYLGKDHHAIRIQQALSQLQNVLAGRSEKKVLELGAATGSVAQMISALGCQVDCNDFEANVLKLAEEKGFQTLNFDVSGSFPLNDGSYDAIFCGELIEHIFDTTSFLKECCRVLRPNGAVVLTTPNLVSLQDRFRFLFGKSPRHVSPSHEYLWLHIRPFTVDTLAGAGEAAGFDLVTLSSNMVTWDTSLGRIRSRALARALPRLGRSLIVTLRKR